MVIDVYGKSLTDSRESMIIELMAKYGIDEEIQINQHKSNRPGIFIHGNVPLELHYDMSTLFNEV